LRCAMGNSCCKCSGGEDKKRGRAKIKEEVYEKKPEEQEKEEEGERAESPEEFEDAREKEEVRLLRTLLHDDLEKFVITQVLLGVQFFKNFDE